MPFSIINAAIRLSRKPWWDVADGCEAQEANSALQVDDRMALTGHEVQIIADQEPNHTRLYEVAIDTRVLRKNDVFYKYCLDHPERIPPDDAGRPVLPILVEFFCTQMWERLVEAALGDGGQVVPTKSLASNAGTASEIFSKKIDRLFAIWDADHNGFVETEELKDAVKECL